MEKVRAWIRENITGDGRNQDFSHNIDSETSEAYKEPSLELPDTPPDPPTPGENPLKYGVEFLGSIMEGIAISSLISVLKHIIEKEDSTKK